MQLAAAVAAPQQSRQQQLAFTGCSASECAAHAGRIVGDYLEVALELVPGDVGRVVILDQRHPIRNRSRADDKLLNIAMPMEFRTLTSR